MFDGRGTRRYTDMGACRRRGKAIEFCCSVYISPNGPFDMPFVRHNHQLDYLRNLQQAIARMSDFRRICDFKLICFNRLYNRLYLVHDAPDWMRELGFLRSP